MSRADGEHRPGVAVLHSQKTFSPLCRATGPIAGHGLDNSLTFFDMEELINFHILQRIQPATWPTNLEKVNLLGFAQTKMHSQVILREITAATAYFIHLRVRLRFAWGLGDAANTSANATAIGLRADCADLDPIVREP
jgi:hypothetical protein